MRQLPPGHSSHSPPMTGSQGLGSRPAAGAGIVTQGGGAAARAGAAHGGAATVRTAVPAGAAATATTGRLARTGRLGMAGRLAATGTKAASLDDPNTPVRLLASRSGSRSHMSFAVVEDKA